MIIVKIHGGLGNQMFQYALGRNLSLLHNVPFKIDSSYLRTANQFGRSFQLDSFNIQAEEATQKEISRYRSTFQKMLDKARPEGRRKKVLERSGAFEPNILKRNDGYFDGHWQHPKYFEANKEKILKDFTLKSFLGERARALSQLIDIEPNAVSLHVRRGDYISISKVSSAFSALPFSYYEEAMNRISIKHPDAHFFISSDDIEWVKSNFPKSHPMTYVSAPGFISDTEELMLVKNCNHNIIANSTFSWWGAYLNQNPNKIVIAPKNWFVDKEKNNHGFIPKTWTRL